MTIRKVQYMNYLEQVEENKKAIKAEIIEYVALECIRNSKGIANYYYEVEFRLNNELSISKEVNDRNNYLDFLNKKLEEVFRSNNPLTVKWRVIQYPLLTTLEKEYNLFFEFDSILKIKRGTNKKENKGGFMNIPSYYNYEIIDYLEGMKPLLNKDNELKEIDVIEFLCNHYYIYSDVKYYESEEFHKNMKDDIKEFLFTYIDYILYSKYKADYINSKQSNNIEEKQIPQPIYDKNNNLYYKLCTPLKKSQEKEVFEIWIKNIEEDIIIRKQEIEEYCKKETCDFISAIYSVYNKIKDKYLCKSRLEGEENFFNYEYEYFEESDLINYIKVRILRKIQPLGLENKYHAQDIVNILDKNLFYDYKDAYEVGFTDYDYAEVMYITRQQVIDEENDIKFQIINSLDKRLEDHKNYINNTLITPCKIENFDSLPEIEKKMYISNSTVTINNMETPNVEIINNKNIIDSPTIVNNNNPQLDEIYKEIYKSLKEFVINASSEKYKKIIEFKLSKKSLNTKEYSKCYIVVNTGKKIDIYRIGKCFELTNDEIRHFIRFKNGNNIEVIRGRITKEEINKDSGRLQAALCSIRNEHLYNLNEKLYNKFK